MADTPASPATARLRRFAIADVLTVARLPLGVAFIAFPATEARLAVLALAAATDLGDGWVARRFGASRIGAVLDPIVDKLFMAAAFGVVAFAGVLAWYEVAGVLLRDAIASAAYFLTRGRNSPKAVPARLGGKAVTTLQ
ncbi:MAG TPA: CDP-alcohol phosphatidyltransferase family protein, partial [Gemmatimonadales bacterium]|nr:CDP-alcohol phosphatidyltransferase family protein [Gemmatimonadales bacterium]